MALLETKNLGITFGGLKAVSDFEISIGHNELVGLIGPNGAGKTTIFNLLTGVYLPTEGEIKVCKKEIAIDNAIQRIRKKIILALNTKG